MSTPQTVETATLGGGCFWCLEEIFLQLKGVTRVRSGYAGGHKPNPTYEEVCGGDTGHAEVVQIEFDPSVISYKEILEVFFATHDPTTPDRQGNDIGPQYRSIILYHTPRQKEIAEEVMEEVEAAGIYADPLVTQLEPLTQFYPAEEYHEKYFRRNPFQPYCNFVIAPKVAKFRRRFADKLVAGKA